jgi:xanthine dehydrogenase YagR molybdenum-binding subunit
VPDPAGERLHVLQDDQVRFFGQPVAVVVAETLECANHAAARLRVEYEAQTPTLCLTSAGQDVLLPPEPGGARADTARGDAEAAFTAAPFSVDSVYEIVRENHNPMEPHATIAAWSGNRLTLWSKTQSLANEAAELEAVFGLDPDSVQVICPYVGGAFGTSLRTWPHVILAAMAARETERPVKLVLSRRQMFYATGHRPQTWQHVALGAQRDGSLLAVVHETRAETSRYEQYAEELTSATTQMYSCPNVRTTYRLVPLDTATPTWMRGPGLVSGMFALECAIDELAADLGIDPIDLRLRNEPALDESKNLPFSSRSLKTCYEAGARRFGWERRNPRPCSMRDGHLRVGWGMAAATYPTDRMASSARARLLPDGTAEVETAASDMGPGTYTSLTQVAADALALSPAEVRVRLGRSDLPPAPIHGGSLTMASVGSAVDAACRLLRTNLQATAADVGLQLATCPSLRAAYAQLVALGGGAPIEAETTSGPGDERRKFSMHTFGAIFAEVSVDPELGIVRVRRLVGAYAAGRVINPRLARSQCIGGMTGGIGMALMEHTVVDARDGRVATAALSDYLVPVNLDICDLDVLFVEERDDHVNPLGVKGLGEIAIVGVAPAIANAIYHATGRRVRRLPITIEDLLAD